MADKTDNPAGDGGNAACFAMAASVLDDYTARLIDMVRQSQSGITINDIEEFLNRYKVEQKSSGKPAYATQFQQCQVAREREILDHSRNEPFKRVLAMRINKLFPAEGDLAADNNLLSRRLLPGFYAVLEKMTGADGLTAGHQVCVDTVQNLRTGAGGRFLWEDLYAAPAVRVAVDDLLIAVVPHLDNLHRRAMWMRDIINNNLAAAEEFSFEGAAEKDWQLDESGTILLLRELFSDFRPRLKSADGAKSLIERHGKQQVQALLAFFKTLDMA